MPDKVQGNLVSAAIFADAEIARRAIDLARMAFDGDETALAITG